MGFYNDQLVPRATNLLLGSKEFGKIRREACDGLRGDVFELGFGSGLNLPYLPPEVTGVWTAEPSRVATQLARKRIAAAPVEVHVGALDGQRLDFTDARFDAALSTMTLCTIPDVDAALAELRRVLKPGATFHFAEHGRSPDPGVAKWQDRLNGLQNHMAGGCNLTREIEALLQKAGFEVEGLRNFYLKGPKPHGYVYIGRAKNP